MNIRHFALSHVGCVRKENQDNLAVIPECLTYIVADGMGGHADGSLASKIAVETITESIRLKKDPESSILHAHEEIIKAQHLDDIYQSQSHMGTTVVMATIDIEKKTYDVHWCGDSRLYHVSSENGTIRQISQDHSIIQELMSQGYITKEESYSHPQRHVITQALGIGEHLKVSKTTRLFSPNDLLILCSDGLNNELDDLEMYRCCLSDHPPTPQDVAEKLVHMTLENGAKDNVTVIVIQFLDE